MSFILDAIQLLFYYCLEKITVSLPYEIDMP